MSTVRASISIAAAPAEVWEVVMDPARLREWVTIHRAVDHVSQNPQAQGATMRQLLRIRGVTFHVDWTLARAEAPHLAQWEGQGPAHSHASIRYELIAEADGTTRFVYTNQLAAPGGRLGVVASRLLVGPISDREAQRSLERLKALVAGTPSS